MTTKKPWLITIDLDGTTLTSSTKNGISFCVPKRNKEVLRKAKELGHMIAVVTGRPWRDTKEIYNMLDLDTIVGNYNGAHIHKPNDRGFVPSKTTLNRKIIEEINKEYFDKYFSNFIIEDDNETLVYDTSDKEMLRKFHVGTEEKIRKISEDQELILDPYSTVYKLKSWENKNEVMELLKSKYGHGLSLRFWNLDETSYIEVNLRAIDKAAAMIKIASYYNIPLHRTIAFGDGSNDIEMLERAQYGIAMKNSSDYVKSFASDVTKFNNDDAGLGIYLEEWLKNHS